MANRFVSFFEKVGSALKKLFTSSTLESQVLSVLSYAAPVVETIFGLVDPALAPAVTSVFNMVKSDLATAYATVAGAQVTAGSPVAAQLAGWLNSVKTNLTALLTDADIKNSAKFSEIETATNGLIAEFDALLANLTPATPPAA